MAFGSLASAADDSKLPPPASVTIDYARDIKPILENSCFQCHGPERPRGKFRLDNRESALKGGNDGVDILPGNSAKSPLIQYVSGLDPDMRMPPPDKGKPLTADQVALLRAWIDQGVAWEAAEPPHVFTFDASPILGYTTVSGDEHKFREHYWQPNGWNGGLEQFDLHQTISPDSSLTGSGHILRDDYKFRLDFQKNDIGFVHSGWTQYRKYFDDVGGFDPFLSPSVSSLNQDLHLDIGRAWIDFGLTLPNWPQIVLGYEYQYKQGSESTLEWGTLDPNGRNINPASRDLHEHTHIIKFDLQHDLAGVHIDENFRGEFYQLSTHTTNIFVNPLFGTPGTYNQDEGYRHFEGVNTFRLERKFNDWLFGSAGYLFSKLNADGSAAVNTTDLSGIFPNNNFQSQQITLERQSHVVNLSGLIGPWDGFSISGGAQAEWTREKGSGNSLLTQIQGGALAGQFPIQTLSDYDTSQVEENVSLRYTKIPFTALFAEARLRQQRIGQTEEQIGDASQFRDPEFLLKTEFSNQMYDVRVGFNTSPWRWISLSAHVRRYDDDSHYNNTVNQQPIGFPAVGYPGFIRRRDLLTDEVETRLVLRPVGWFRTTLSYQLLSTAYHTDTYPATFGPDVVISPGGEILAGESVSHIYSLNTTFTPHQRLYLSATFSFQDSSTVTAANAAPAVAPYRGGTYSALASVTYVLNRNSDLLLSYSFSHSDFEQDNFAAGLPVGLRYQQHALQAGITRRLSKCLTTRLQYGYFYYNEPTSGGANNYTAHSIFGMLALRLQ